MAKTTSFGYTNGEATTAAKAPTFLGNLGTNYGVIEDKAGNLTLSNLTAPTDQPERITFMSQPLKRVNTSFPIAYPATNEMGVQYTVKVEDVVRISDATAGSSYTRDIPVKVTLSVQQGISDDISTDNVLAVISRAVGALYDAKDSTGSSRVAAMQRGAVNFV